MGDKERYYWHKKWRWSDDNQRVIHDSGLQFEIIGGIWTLIATSYHPFAESETARGVPEWQLKGRLIKLTKEAQKWATDPRHIKQQHPRTAANAPDLDEKP